ncbi:helix-turn-helix domain-containing protein [bacterium]|nr:helix-turn-helix domain-containing protein [bacterium]
MNDNTPDILTIHEAAKYLGIHIKTVRRLTKEGKLPGRKVFGAWLFQRSALDDWKT